MNLKRNRLICGDNLKALEDLKKQGNEVDLIYLDPPFFSNKQYEVVWGDEAEVRSFKDRWAGGINVYIEWMKERVIKMYELLKDNGSFYLHCDRHASHYLKVMLDEIFGHRNFRNEIVWRIGWVSGYKTQKKGWIRNHDILFYYTKSNDFVFNKEYIPYPDGYKRRDGSEPKGKGIPIEDTWNCNRADILDSIMIKSFSREKMGYPTQKPEALLERIIKASSNKGDIVLDPFCGCGTAMVAARKLERRWVGIDISPTALTVIERRLAKYGIRKDKDFDVIGMPTTLSELRALEPFEFQNWVVNEMKAKHSKRLVADMGLNGYYDKTIFTDDAGIQVKQSEKVGRIVIDNFETALRRRKYQKGFIVAFSFTKGSYEEVARVKGKGLVIKLIKVEDLLLGKIKIFGGENERERVPRKES